ncbi:MAG TPA: hypothetical protein VH678_05125 [Xanthobacteraceae bacterium]|jgi:hypothetical protein
MKSKLLIAGALAAAAYTTPALADFYVVREGTGPCRVVETRPTDTKTIVVGNKVYKTHDEAQKQVTTVCK